MDSIIELARTLGPYAICGEGNVSVKDDDCFWVKASGTSLDTLEKKDLVACKMSGVPFDSLGLKPSIETSFHAWLQREFDAVLEPLMEAHKEAMEAFKMFQETLAAYQDISIAIADLQALESLTEEEQEELTSLLEEQAGLLDELDLPAGDDSFEDKAAAKLQDLQDAIELA